MYTKKAYSFKSILLYNDERCLEFKFKLESGFLRLKDKTGF